MKIIAIGWNYAEHNAELYKEEKKGIVLFQKPETALLKDNKPFYLPDFSDDVQYETEIVVRISKMGKNISPKFADRYYDAIGLGIDFTARDLQRKAKEQGAPWDISKGFDGAAPVSNFLPKEDFADVQNIDFSLVKNGVLVQSGNTKDMITSIAEIIAEASKYFTLKTGDLIFTGTPKGVGRVQIDDHLEGYIGDQKMLDFFVK